MQISDEELAKYIGTESQRMSKALVSIERKIATKVLFVSVNRQPIASELMIKSTTASLPKLQSKGHEHCQQP